MSNNRSTCGIIIDNGEGQILLQRRDNKSTIPFPNLLGTFGGKIEFGETAEQAMYRELKEELVGYEFGELKFWKKFIYDGYEIFMFAIVDSKLNLAKIKVMEGQSGEWINEDYLIQNKNDFAFNCNDIALEYFENKKNNK
jgi:mutator protein MutT